MAHVCMYTLNYATQNGRHVIACDVVMGRGGEGGTVCKISQSEPFILLDFKALFVGQTHGSFAANHNTMTDRRW